MISFNWKKNIEDSIKDGLIISINHDRNIVRTKDGKRKTTKGVPRCHGYYETCWWNSRWCPCQRLYSLLKMDQRVIQQQTFIALLRAIKLHNAK